MLLIPISAISKLLVDIILSCPILFTTKWPKKTMLVAYTNSPLRYTGHNASRNRWLIAPKTSTLLLSGMSLLNLCTRFYTRIRIQEEFDIDDLFLILGLCYFIFAMALLSTFINKMSRVEAFGLEPTEAKLSPDFIHDAFDYQRIAAVFLVLTWCCIASVKFSCLFLFERSSTAFALWSSIGLLLLHSICWHNNSQEELGIGVLEARLL